MRDYVIITDATCDLPIHIITKFNLEVIPMTYTIDGKDYQIHLQDQNLKLRDFYDQLRNGELATTSQINSYTYEKVIEKYLQQNLDCLIINFSSALSGGFNSLRIAKENLSERYPNHNIVIFDSKCASMGEGLLVYLALQEKAKGYTIYEVEKWLQLNHLRICHWFIVDDLDFLKRGGRLSGSSAFVGRLLKIKPVLHVDNQGRLVPVKKAIGKAKAIDELFLKFKERALDISQESVFISHGDCYDEALVLKEKILSEFKPKEIIIGEIGPIIGSHSGPGTLALFFIGYER